MFLEFLESALILGFSGKSLVKERIAEIILGKCELNKIYQIIPQCSDSCHTSPHPFTPPT